MASQSVHVCSRPRSFTRQVRPAPRRESARRLRFLPGLRAAVKSYPATPVQMGYDARYIDGSVITTGRHLVGQSAD